MKLFKLLILLAVLGFGYCSVIENNFLDQVKGKVGYTDPVMTVGNEYGDFSIDGKELTTISSPIITYILESVSDDDTAVYKVSTSSGTENYTFDIEDNKLTITAYNLPAGSNPIVLYLKF